MKFGTHHRRESRQAISRGNKRWWAANRGFKLQANRLANELRVHLTEAQVAEVLLELKRQAASSRQQLESDPSEEPGLPPPVSDPPTER